MSEKYDVVFIGGGPAGYVGGIRAAQLGARVAVVEKDTLGGVCLNRGCIPTKTLMSSAKALISCRTARDFGIDVNGEVAPDFPRIMARKNKVVSTLVKGIKSNLKSRKIAVLEGEAKYLDPHRISIRRPDGISLEIEAVSSVICTGSVPATIPAFPINGLNILTSDHLFEIKELPKSILVIGAGAIGCEWGFILNTLGVDVTIIEMLPHAAPLEDDDISVLLEREMKKLKIKFYSGEKIISLGESPDKHIVAQTESGKEIRVEKVLVSIGRAVNTEALDLAAAGVETNERGFVKVNERMETNVPGIYAAGDVVPGPQLAHVAMAEAKVASANALGQSEIMEYGIIPQAMFTFPEAASVGLREREAKEKGLDYKTARFPFRALGKAHAQGEISGEVKLIVESGTNRIIGAHIIGPGATTLVHEAAMAMRCGASADDMARTVHAHPTLSEAMLEAAEAIMGNSIHLP